MRKPESDTVRYRIECTYAVTRLESCSYRRKKNLVCLVMVTLPAAKGGPRVRLRSAKTASLPFHRWDGCLANVAEFTAAV